MIRLCSLVLVMTRGCITSAAFATDFCDTLASVISFTCRASPILTLPYAWGVWDVFLVLLHFTNTTHCELDVSWVCGAIIGSAHCQRWHSSVVGRNVPRGLGRASKYVLYQHDLAQLLREWKHGWIVMGWGGVWRVRQTWQETLKRPWIQCAVACQPRPQAATSGLTGGSALWLLYLSSTAISGPQESMTKASNSSKGEKSFHVWSFNDHRSKEQHF